jgi:rubredoxin
MKSAIAILSAICILASSAFAFAPPIATRVVVPSTSTRGRGTVVPSSPAAYDSIVPPPLSPYYAASATSLSVFGKRKTEAQKAEEEAKASQYWAGEWVCKDCGYIYNRAECAGMYFEEQGPGFRCPQCSGPRRRYAKKVGDRVGTTLDGGDAPILLFSFGGLIATIAFGIWAVQNL